MFCIQFSKSHNTCKHDDIQVQECRNSKLHWDSTHESPYFWHHLVPIKLKAVNVDLAWGLLYWLWHQARVARLGLQIYSPQLAKDHIGALKAMVDFPLLTSSLAERWFSRYGMWFFQLWPVAKLGVAGKALECFGHDASVVGSSGPFLGLDAGKPQISCGNNVMSSQNVGKSIWISACYFWYGPLFQRSL